jgi:peptidoglycan/LPS O-acetylase OafA/YrhL
MLIMAVIGNFNYISKFLIFCGTIAYEIYLIHGPLLIKYNIFFKWMPLSLIAVSFLIYLFCLLILSYWFYRIDRVLASR